MRSETGLLLRVAVFFLAGHCLPMFRLESRLQLDYASCPSQKRVPANHAAIRPQRLRVHRTSGARPILPFDRPELGSPLPPTDAFWTSHSRSAVVAEVVVVVHRSVQAGIAGCESRSPLRMASARFLGNDSRLSFLSSFVRFTAFGGDRPAHGPTASPSALPCFFR